MIKIALLTENFTLYLQTLTWLTVKRILQAISIEYESEISIEDNYTHHRTNIPVLFS